MALFPQQTLLEKKLLHPHLRQKIDMDRIFVLPVGWNWHEMHLWLLPNEIQPYHGRTFTLMPNGIVEVQKRSLDGHFPKFAFALWQVGINNCIFFSQFSLIVLIMPRPTPIGIRHEVVALAHEDMRKVLLLVAWVWLVLLSTTSSRGMLPLELWCQSSPRVSLEDHTSSRPYFVQDGLTGSLHKCSGRDSMDEKFVWNEGRRENYQQSARVPWLLYI